MTNIKQKAMRQAKAIKHRINKRKAVRTLMAHLRELLGASNGTN